MSIVSRFLTQYCAACGFFNRLLRVQQARNCLPFNSVSKLQRTGFELCGRRGFRTKDDLAAIHVNLDTIARAEAPLQNFLG